MPGYPQRYISIVMTSGDPRELVSQVHEIWNQYFADSSFDYFFLDQFFDHQYRQDEVFGVMIGAFTGFGYFHFLFGTLDTGHVFMFHTYQRNGDT